MSRREIVVVGCLLLVLLGVACSVHAAPVLSGKIMDLTNAERAKAKIPALSANPRLMKAAVLLADDLLKNQYFSDAKRFQTKVAAVFSQVKYQLSGVGWIVYAGQATEAQLVAQSMKNPGTKKWLLAKTSTETGVAVLEGKVSSAAAAVIVQLFGSEKKGAASGAAASALTPGICGRKTPYPVAPEAQGGLEAAFHNEQKYSLDIPYPSIKNCLHITFSDKTPEGAVAIFNPQVSSKDNLRIIINQKYASSGHEILGAVLVHEITHAWYFDEYLLAQAGRAGFLSFVPPTCGDNEALAYYNEIKYVNSLSEGDHNELNDYIKKFFKLYQFDKLGIGDLVYLMDFYHQYYGANSKNFIAFMRDQFVLSNPYYQNQCGVR